MSYLNANTARTTLSSFLTYFVMSAIISPLGIVSGALVTRYEISLTYATALFSYLTTGVLIGSFVALFVIPRFGPKIAVLVFTPILILTLIATRSADAAWILPISFLSIGTCCGVILSAAAIVLTATYSEQHRASALLATDSFYSLAGFVSTPLAGYVVAQAMHWTYAYATAFVAAIVICLLAIVSRYPKEMADQTEEADVPPERWPFSVFLAGMAFVIYLICFVTIYSWIPPYTAEVFGATPKEGADVVSQFFLGLLVGQLIMFFVALRLDVRIVVGVCVAGAFFASFGLWTATSLAGMAMATFGLGFIAGGFLKPLVAFGTQLMKRPTSRLVGFYMFCMAVGSSLGPALSAYIVEQSSMKTVLIANTVGIGLTGLLVFATFPVYAKLRASIKAT